MAPHAKNPNSFHRFEGGSVSRGPMPRAGSGAIRMPKSAPKPPEFLSGESLSEWKRIVPELERAGLLTEADRAVLAAYCQAYEELVVCTRIVKDEGRFLDEDIQTSKGEHLGTRKITHPALKAQRDAARLVRTFLDSLGLTPAARRRMQADDETDDDDLMKVLSGRN